MAIEKELLDQLLADRGGDEVFSKDGLLDDLKKALSERILNAELDEHLGAERSEGNANRLNGTSKEAIARGKGLILLVFLTDGSILVLVAVIATDHAGLGAIIVTTRRDC